MQLIIYLLLAVAHTKSIDHNIENKHTQQVYSTAHSAYYWPECKIDK